MRQLFFLLVIAFCTSCLVTKDIHHKAYPLNGEWIPIQQEMGGKILPMSAMGDQKLMLKDTSYTLVAESIDKGAVQYANGKMDIYGREGVNTGKHFMAIYKMENELLTICYDLSGSSYPASYETSSHPYYFRSVFKKSSN
jgi:uncharacterized protein (TIGR03067 family)